MTDDQMIEEDFSDTFPHDIQMSNMTPTGGPEPAPDGVTCDCCASGAKRCTVEPESGAYICEDCTAFHKRALEAATAAILHGYVGCEVRVFADQMASVAVKAYLEFTDEPQEAR